MLEHNLYSNKKLTSNVFAISVAL